MADTLHIDIEVFNELDLTVVGADAGLHLSVLLPPGLDDREVLRRAAARGVTGSALSSCYAGRRRRSGLVLGFGGSANFEYEGKTLRENLGLPRPENRFFSATAKAAE